MTLTKRVLHVAVDLFEKSAEFSAVVSHVTGVNAFLVRAAWRAVGLHPTTEDSVRYTEAMYPVAQEMYRRSADAYRTGIDAGSFDVAMQKVVEVGAWYGNQCVEVGCPLMDEMLKAAA